MENQHRKITGYRELNEQETAAINEIKQSAEEVRCLIESIINRPAVNADGRWASIARTHLQEGFMALTRAVAKPTTF